MEDNNQTTVVLEETFYVTSKKNTYYVVKLTEKGLSVQKESNGSTKIETIALADIVGCRCMRSKRRSAGSCVCRPGTSKSQLRLVESTANENYQSNYDEFDTSAYLHIYAYVLKKQRVKSFRRRERTTITLRFRSFDKYEDNLGEACRWRVAIKCLIAKIPVPTNLKSPTHGIFQSLSDDCSRDNRKLLVILNPKSGPGKARETFQKRIHPILSEAEKPYDIFITKCPNHARELVRTKNIYQWDGFLMIGGDGIFFEVINGLLQRPDWERALKELPLGVIPCGSGNGLAKSIAHAQEEPFDHNPILISTLAVVKCKKSPMDLVRVETRKQISFSFLSIGWGLLSDIDIESECLRALGGQRFTVWSVARLIGLRTYKGKVSYLPCDKGFVDDNTCNGNIYHKDCPTDEKISHSRSYAGQLDRIGGLPCSKSFHDTFKEENNGIELINGTDINEMINENLSLETKNDTRQRLDSFYSATSRKSTYFSTSSISSYHSIDDSNSTVIDTENIGDNKMIYGPSSTLPALTALLPDSWVHIQDDFIMVHAAYQSHLAQDCHFAPRAKLADGIIWLLIIRAGISRVNLLQFLLGMSNRTHLSCPGVEMIPVKAFRIEPAEETGGYLTVDGEKVDYGPLQAEIFPSLASVMTP